MVDKIHRSYKSYMAYTVFILVIGIGFAMLMFVIGATWIGLDVKERCKTARYKYGGSCTEALVKRLDDNTESFAERNSAIWALGQLGDKDTLPILEKYYTGNIPQREPWNKTVSQYELKKAIKLVKGGTNITAVFWR